MIGIRDFSEWLLADPTTTRQARKLIMGKVSEFINLNSIEAKEIKPMNNNIIVDKVS